LKLTWKVKLGIILVIISFLVYELAYLAYGHEKVLFYILIDLAFIPLDILVITLVIESIISNKEKESFLEKLDMILGVFFSEIGTDFLAKFSKINQCEGTFQQKLCNIGKWEDKEYKIFLNNIKEKNFKSDLILPQYDTHLFFEDMKETLTEKRQFLMRLLENPNLLEKDSFSNLLLAIFHLDDELESRRTLENLPKTDFDHLIKDIERVYCRLIYEWVNYLFYLKDRHPYIFSIAVRTNPFDKNSDIYVRD